MGNGSDKSPDVLWNRFWSEIKIRKKTPHEVIEIIRAHKQGDKPIDPNKYQNFISSILENPELKEESIKLFTAALTAANDRQNEGLLFLALLFLGKCDDPIEFTKIFISLSHTQGNMASAFSQMGDDVKKYTVQKAALEQILKFYWNMISWVGVDALAGKCEDPAVFTKTANKAFSEENQEKVVKRILNSYSEDVVLVENFVREKWNELKNDKDLRKEMFDMFMEEEHKKDKKK